MNATTATNIGTPFTFVNKGRTVVHPSHDDCTPTTIESYRARREAAGVCTGCGWAFTADRHAIPTTVTVGEGVVVRKCEETASRDHNVTLVPGTYPLTPTRNPEGHLSWLSAAIPAIAHDYWRSTVEFGGVALAGEHRGGELETYGYMVRGYEIGDTIARGTYTFA